MPKQPAVIIIARNWVATAEKPYDPPLSYGGWMQCQSLGIRISNELHNLDKKYGPAAETKDEFVSTDAPPPKKRKIIIHSSPFIRCVQTSIAITAGLQHPQNHSRPRPRPRQRSSRAAISPTEMPEPGTEPTDSSEESPLRRTNSRDQPHTNRLGYNTCRLRLDPFLGEWLSPSYFEHGNPPPPSAVLVSEAKLSLQTPQEEIKGADLSHTLSELPSVEWDEKENDNILPPAQEKTGLKAMAAAGHSFPKRARNISFGAELANGARLLNRALRQPLGYSPPLPTYAIAPSEKIPPGFVAHARDSCLEVDQDWDSQSDPLGWGDGGPYDEEWGGMHRRFRNGLQKMIAHYEKNSEEELQDNEDLVLVIVTHQAGCNALIRLLTGAPALHEVGTASLTMAVRKPGERVPSTPISPTRRRGSLDSGLSLDYDMKIIASTEHLRAASNPLGLNSPRLGFSPAFASRRPGGVDAPEGFSIGESSTSGRGMSLTPARSSSQRAHAADRSPSGENPTGLWRGGSRYSRDESTGSSDAGVTPSVGSGETGESAPEIQRNNSDANTLKVDTQLLPVRSASQRGLWGGESIKRERSPGKRRWTAVERSP
ncbi:uncharacterized protein A1O9_02323 [Exophiala aquamarina CBS 119918]|uniref:Phosphoglycerate mutase n=1 Tax=Exophiala aquamarina CBS 119918 TaxID=1182545 RepID=A0A072PM32_9EURO|nr:uncharacterized protein A1O9_02323 [Exophiala aquamarina CBS 119918]KEF60762.1 hypothetical protein A1O9_02323 [Exophiala aquamarina CBS 119918]